MPRYLWMFIMKTLTSVGCLQTLQNAAHALVSLLSVCHSFSLPFIQPPTHKNMPLSLTEAICGRAAYCVVKCKGQQ